MPDRTKTEFFDLLAELFRPLYTRDLDPDLSPGQFGYLMAAERDLNNANKVLAAMPEALGRFIDDRVRASAVTGASGLERQTTPEAR